MVVAEGLGAPGQAPYTIADASGDYIIYNVPDGTATVRGYRSELELEPVEVEVAGEAVTDVHLEATGEGVEGLGSVSGSVNIVNAPGDSATSVVLVPVSVFNEALERGPVPFGLRAPAPPEAPSVTSGFEIPGVPAGDYKVLAAFENDDLVRDPDDSIAGTAIQEISLGSGETVDVPEAFKVTEHIAVISPGADEPEIVDPIPTLIWADDSSETHYSVIVFDALGNVMWELSLIHI